VIIVIIETFTVATATHPFVTRTFIVQSTDSRFGTIRLALRATLESSAVIRVSIHHGPDSAWLQSKCSALAIWYKDGATTNAPCFSQAGVLLFQLWVHFA
jgi:hypothetical protein